MHFEDYQKIASQTVQTYNLQNQEHFLLGYLGLAGESGSVLTTLKKLLRDGDGFGTFDERLQEELGDVLWYIASIATHNNLSLENIVQANLEKTKERYLGIDMLTFPRLDEHYIEKFPDSFIVNFKESTSDIGLAEVRMIWEKENGEVAELGDPLTDNSKIPNNYRYHDVFHLGHVAFLGWSPVLRQLMKLKRKSDSIILDAEDRGRPQVAEEAITLIVFNYAKGNNMLEKSDRLDTELLHTIRQLVVDLEVAIVSSFHWELTIVNSYKVYHQLVKNKGGRVLVSIKDRLLRYID
jgi:NTP pyrophosphatase (non-canonical NTP hydrolase)